MEFRRVLFRSSGPSVRSHCQGRVRVHHGQCFRGSRHARRPVGRGTDPSTRPEAGEVTTTAVVVCTRTGPCSDLVEETEAALALGRGIASSIGGELRWLVLGPASGDLAGVAARPGGALFSPVPHK